MTNRQVALLVAVIYSIAVAVSGKWPDATVILGNASSFCEWLDSRKP